MNPSKQARSAFLAVENANRPAYAAKDGLTVGSAEADFSKRGAQARLD
ncbi:MAG: hypothetical protein JO266_10855 [Acidobacteria bacterium]|nr:hypothetical protein [Acidobacteriota bacterium]